MMSAAENRAVFLSYASQDAEAARRICEALRSGGVEVWFDADGGLEHGDEWDAKIRRQIKECVLFIAVISANTQARPEGYFRIEWDLAAERARGIASGVPFLLPVVIDDTREPNALVPDRFRAVQWTRLRGGEVPAEVQQRFLKLWSHRTGVLNHEAARSGSEPGRPRPGERHEGVASPVQAELGRSLRGRLAWVAAAAMAIAALAAWKFWPNTETAPRDPELARAAALFDFNSPDSTAEGFALADDILKTVLAKRPADTDAVILYAWLNSLFMTRGFDMSEERRSLARQFTERAVKLAPQNADALAAQGTYYLASYAGHDPARAEQLLRQAIAIKPHEPFYHRMLSFTLADQGKREEARRNARHALELFPGNALVHYDYGLVQLHMEDFEGAEKAFRGTLAFTPLNSLLYGGLHADLASFAAFSHADLPMMKGWLDKMPAQFRDNARESMPAFIYALASGDTEHALATVRQLPNAWLRNYGETPKALIAGDLLMLQGKSEQARGQFEAAHAEVTQARAKDPGKIRYRQIEVWTLLRLGRMAEARAALPGVIEATNPLGFDRLYPMEYWYGPLAASLVLGEKEAALSYLRKAATTVGWRRYFRNLLQIDVRVKDWRSDPEIVAQLNRPAKSTAALVSAPDPKSVAVLAFANLSDDRENEYFSDGIADELLTTLQKIPGLRVAARTSAFSFKGKNATAKEVGEKLGMAHVVEGSVQKSGKRVKITARLSLAATNEAVWSESFGPLEPTDIFATQSEIAQKIVASVRGQLTGGTTSAATATAAQAEIKAQVQAATKGGTKNPEAHQLYLQGRFLATRAGSADVARGIDYYEQALKLDPNFAVAWAALARARLWQLSWEPLNPERAQQAQIAATRALAVDSDMAEAHSVIAQVKLRYAFEWRAARAASARALALAPSDVAVLTDAAATEQALGSLEKSIELARRAVGLDPVSVDTRFYLAMSYLFAGRLLDAEAETRRLIELSSNGIFSHGNLSCILLLQGRAKEALAAAQLEPEKMYRLQMLAGAYHTLGQKRESDAALATLHSELGQTAPYAIAWVYMWRREFDQAFEWLERSYQLRDAGISWVRCDSVLKPLHADPRWPAFLRKIGLADDQLK